MTGTFTYNPTLLTVTPGTSSNPALSGTTFTVAVPTAGTATWTYTDGAGGPNESKLKGGIGANGSYNPNALIPRSAISAPALGFINATVSNSSAATPIYKAKDVMTISNVVINGPSTPVLGASAIHLVAFVGDADGDGSYTNNDGTLMTNVMLSTDSGFAAYPLVDPVVVADTDGSGYISSNGIDQVNNAANGYSTNNLPNPPIPTGADVTPISNNVDPTIRLPNTIDVGTGGIVTVPVSIDDPDPAGSTGLIRAHLVLSYDSQALSVSAGDVRLGSVLQPGTGWSISTNINAVSGELVIWLSSDTPIRTTVGGSLVTIDFHALSSLAKATAISLVVPANANGDQQSVTELEDAQGAFVLTAPANDALGSGTAVVIASGSSVTPGQGGPETASFNADAQVASKATNDAAMEGRSDPEPEIGNSTGFVTPVALATPAEGDPGKIVDSSFLAAIEAEAAPPHSGPIIPSTASALFIAQLPVELVTVQSAVNQVLGAIAGASINFSNPNIGSAGRNGMEHAVPSALLSYEWSANTPDDLLHDLAPDLALPMPAELMVSLEGGSQQTPVFKLLGPSSPVSYKAANQLALDQYFADNGDGMDYWGQED